MKSTFTYTTLVLMAFVVAMNFIFMPSHIISWDVYGYYLYLPTFFIYNDIGLVNEQVILDLLEQYQNSTTFYQAHSLANGNYAMKYSMGMAVLYAPFFAIGYIWSLFSAYPTDGFSLPFQLSVWAGGVIVSLVGIWLWAKVMFKLFAPKIAVMAMLMVVLGTNYMIHSTMYGQNLMSQNFLFTLYAALLWYTIQWHQSFKPKYLLGIAAIAAIMTLSRPTEIVAFIIPICWGVTSWNEVKHKWRMLMLHKWALLASVGLVAFIGGWQLVYWKTITGQWVYNSYGANAGEGLELLAPYTAKFLFSFRKGWLVYTPLMLVALLGMYTAIKQKRAFGWMLFIFTLVNIYLISSWSNWWYAQSFSQRAMVSSYPVLALGIGSFLTYLHQRISLKALAYTVIVVLVGLNVFQTIQYHRGIIHGDRMTWPYYQAVFGELDHHPENQKHLLIDRSFAGNYTLVDSTNYEPIKKLSLDFPSDSVYYLHGESKYSPVIDYPVFTHHQLTHAWVKVTADVWISDSVINPNVMLYCCFMHNGFGYAHKNVIPNPEHTNQWQTLTLYYLTPEVRVPEDNMRVFVVNESMQQIQVKNISATVLGPIYDPV